MGVPGPIGTAPRRILTGLLRPRNGLAAVRVESIGLRVNDPTIANRIATGGFSTVFFLQVMEAIGVKNLQLDSGD